MPSPLLGPPVDIDNGPSATFHHTTFDAVDLTRRKQAAGTTISVVIPALNEEATVGTVVERFAERLIHQVPLIDEIVVVDADSTDATARRARAAGARVVRQSEVLPEAGARTGKGEALWKGLATSFGDLVVFVDADIVDVDERFVVGLVGPLLTVPSVSFTKATYDRPFRLGDTQTATGGGRVTELMARPLIAAFWPQLSWLAQPLSGEYAGRRELLESLPFVCGYGVELAMLIDIADRFGPKVIAQVDLDARTHVHQTLDALGRMAAEILAVAFGRLERTDRLVLTEQLGEILAQPTRDERGELVMTHHPVAPVERPALIDWFAQH